MATLGELKRNDVVVSKDGEGYRLSIVTVAPGDPLDLVYRGDGWSLQLAIAKGARLAESKGGNLWYTGDRTGTFEYLETFRRQRERLET